MTCFAVKRRISIQRIVIFGCIFALITITVFIHSIHGQSSWDLNPRLKFSHSDLTYDIGVIRQNTSKEFLIAFENAGGAPLLIEKVESDCSCTVVEFTQQPLQPGRRGEIRGTIAVGRKGGQFVTYLHVKSNDSSAAVLTLILTANIEVLFDIEPNFVYFGSVTMNASVQPKFLRLIGRDVEKATVTGIDLNSQFLDVTFIDKDSFHPEPKIEVALVPGVPPGNFTTSFRVMTDHPEHSTLFVSVHAYIVANIIVTPPEILFVRDHKNEYPVFTITVLNRRIPDFIINEVTIPEDPFPGESSALPSLKGVRFVKPGPDDLRISVSDHNQKNEIQITLVLKRSLNENERLHGLVEIRTNDPYEPYAKITYRASGRRNVPGPHSEK